MAVNDLENSFQNNSSNDSIKPKRVSKNGKPLGRPSYASQGKQKKADTMHTYKIDVPNGDVSVIQWMDMQDDPAISIRLLIKDYITRKGFHDVACLPVDYNPVGRKPKETISAETQAVRETSETTTTETKASKTEVAPKVESRPQTVVMNDDEDDDDMSAFFGRNRL